MGNNSLADAAAFRNAAATGQVGVDPDAAQAVLTKIRTGKDAVETLLGGAGALAEPPKLGANPVGHAIAAKVSERADGGGDSYASALRNLLFQYEQAEQGILAAMRHYQNFDGDVARSLNGGN